MDERQAEYRQNAADCLDMAKNATDDQQRRTLLLMAQKWLDLARDTFGRRRFAALLTEFNDDQMRQQ
jgi:hypothetical protein